MAVKKERKIPKGMKVCPECEDGWRVVEEHGQFIRDACYHCGNTGFITDEQVFANRVRGVACSLAAEAVQRLKEATNSNPDGEGWSFHAAENMLSEYDYTTGRVWEYEGRMMEVLEKMLERDRLLLEVLMDRLDPDGKAETPEPVKAEEVPEDDREAIQPGDYRYYHPPAPLNPPPPPPPTEYKGGSDDDIPF